ncbi:MAG: phasin family protein [Sphingobium sp.]
MAVPPKTPDARPMRKAKSASSPATLSATEALKAAETAIAPVPAGAPRQKAARPASVSSRPAPAAIVASTTVVDAAPEPDAVVAAPGKVFSSADRSNAVPLPAIEGKLMMTDVLETGKKFAEEAKAKIESVYADLNEKAKANVEKSTKTLEDVSDLARGNVEALVESGKIAAKGFETIGQDAVDYSRRSFEKATASIKSFSTAKTPTEFFQLQSQFLSSSFDDFTKEAARSGEAFLKLAGEVTQPLTARVTVVTDKVKTLAA